MKKNLKPYLICMIAAIVFSAGCALFSNNPLLTFIDVLSILSLVFIVVGLLEFLIQGGYFDFLSYSFSSAKNLLSRHSQPAGSQRYFDYAQKQKERRGTSSHFVLKLAVLLLALSILLTIFYELL